MNQWMIVFNAKIQRKYNISQCNFEPEFAVLLTDKILYAIIIIVKKPIQLESYQYVIRNSKLSNAFSHRELKLG